MRIKTAAITALLIVMLVLVGCGADDSSSSGDTESGTEPAAASSEDEKSLETQLQEQYGDTDWFARIDHIANVTKLRHPVTEIHFVDTVNDIRGSYLNDVQAAVSSILFNNYYHEIYGTDGAAGGGGSFSDESVELPAMPASIEELAGWMEEAYGASSGDPVEEWFTHITGYELDPDSWGDGDTIVIKTDLADIGYEPGPEREMVILMRYAVASAEIDWAEGLQAVDATGENLTIGDYSVGHIPYRGY